MKQEAGKNEKTKKLVLAAVGLCLGVTLLLFGGLGGTTAAREESERIGAALPVLMQHFVPLRAKITHLHLCAFWPTREILTVELTGTK